MITIPGRIPIKIYPFFWFLIIIIGWINSFTVLGTAIWAIVILLSVLIHEYGHALTALAFGQEADIELVGLGGVTHRHGKKVNLWQEFIIVFNGPLAGLLLFFAAYFAATAMNIEKPKTIFEYAIEITLYANLFWTAVNLLPIHPLDGGRLLSIVLEAAFGMRGVKAGYFLSFLLSLAVSIFFFVIQAFLGGALFLLLTFESYRMWKSSLVLTEKDRDVDLQQLLKQAEDEMGAGHFESAKETLEKIRSSTQKGMLYLNATTDLANLFYRQGKLNEVYDLLAPLKSKLPADTLRILHDSAFRLGKLKEAIEIGDKTYQIYPSYETALINSLGYALLGEVQPAVGWLQRSISDGLPNIKAIFGKEEFDAIRSHPLFKEMQMRHLKV